MRGSVWVNKHKKQNSNPKHRNRIRNGPEDSADPFKSKKKSFSKVPLVGTLNLYLVTPDAMQKTKNWSDHPGLRKRPKTAEKLQYLILSSFRTFSQPRMIGSIFRFLLCVRRHKIQV